MEELVFLIEESDEGGFITKGLDVAIFTQGGTYEAVKLAVIGAVHLSF
jgi:hypothetical protein